MTPDYLDSIFLKKLRKLRSDKYHGQLNCPEKQPFFMYTVYFRQRFGFTDQ